MEIRRRFAYGEQRDFLSNPDVIGWTRAGDAEHGASGVAAILTDRSESQLTMEVGSEHAGETWRCVIGEEDDVPIADDGTAIFKVSAGKLSVYLPEAAIKTLDCDSRVLRRARARAIDPSPAA